MAYYCFNPSCSDRVINDERLTKCPACGTNVMLVAKSQEKASANPKSKTVQVHYYKAVRLLGSGGMAETLLVVEVDEHGNKKIVDGKFLRYAFKRLVRSYFADSHTWTIAKALFKDEAEALWQLGSHLQIADYQQYVPDDVNGPFIVQEYIEGAITLQERVTKYLEVYNETELIRFLLELTPVLEEIHKAGTIHRDVKPANIVYPGTTYMGRKDRTTKPYLVDFGIAMSSKTLGSLHVKAARASGTPEYMAPEHAEGNATARSDIFSLGLCALFAWNGQDAIDSFDRRATPTEEKRFAERLTKELPNVGPVIAKMTRLREQDRYNSATELYQALIQAQSPKTGGKTIFTTALQTVVAAPGHKPQGKPIGKPSVLSATVMAAHAPKKPIAIPYRNILLSLIFAGTIGMAYSKWAPTKISDSSGSVPADESQAKESGGTGERVVPIKAAPKSAPSPVASEAPWKEVEVLSGFSIRMPASVGNNEGTKDYAKFVAEENGLRYTVSSYRMQQPLAEHSRASAIAELKAVARHQLGDGSLEFGKVHATREGFPTILVQSTTKKGYPIFARITLGNRRGFMQAFTLVGRKEAELGDEKEAFLNSVTVSANLSKDLGFERMK